MTENYKNHIREIKGNEVKYEKDKKEREKKG